MAYVTKGIATFSVKYITDEFGNRIADGVGGYIVDDYICESSWYSSFANIFPTVAFRITEGIILTHSDFLIDEFGNYITDEFGNRIATKVIPGSIWSTDRELLSQGQILFFGTYRDTYILITETSSRYF